MVEKRNRGSVIEVPKKAVDSLKTGFRTATLALAEEHLLHIPLSDLEESQNTVATQHHIQRTLYGMTLAELGFESYVQRINRQAERIDPPLHLKESH